MKPTRINTAGKGARTRDDERTAAPTTGTNVGASRYVLLNKRDTAHEDSTDTEEDRETDGPLVPIASEHP